jgi:molybdopterin synthase catalytic subunit
MDLNRMIKGLKKGPDFAKIGMIVSHLGIVRGHSLNGKTVQGMEVSFDQNVLANIHNEIKMMDGIVDVLIDISEGTLAVGDEVMAVVVGGDTREHVFPALIEAVNRIKSEATTKREIF